MKIVLGRPIVSTQGRKHADAGDTLDVIFREKKHFICLSKYFENSRIVVFNNQVEKIVRETNIYEDEHADEKYYNVYEEPKSVETNDPFYTAFGDEEE